MLVKYIIELKSQPDAPSIEIVTVPHHLVKGNFFARAMVQKHYKDETY